MNDATAFIEGVLSQIEGVFSASQSSQRGDQASDRDHEMRLEAMNDATALQRVSCLIIEGELIGFPEDVNLVSKRGKDGFYKDGSVAIQQGHSVNPNWITTLYQKQ